jgi:hypothetical protein
MGDFKVDAVESYHTVSIGSESRSLGSLECRSLSARAREETKENGKAYMPTSTGGL